MEIKTNVKKLKENKVEFTIDVPADIFKKSVGSAYRGLSKKAKIPGFRAGKIPAKVIDNYFGKGYVLQQALEKDLPKYYGKALEDSGVQPIARPNIEILSMEENKDLKFKAQVEVEPELKLANYKDLKAKHNKPKVKAEDVEAQVKAIVDRFAELKPAPSKTADKGDHVLINFDGEVEGKPFDVGSAENFMLELGSNTLLPEFEKQLIGSKAGDIKNINVSFSPENPNKEIAGKEAKFKVLVKEVKVKKLPEINDKFVKESTGFKNLTELKKEIKKDMQQQLDKQADAQYRMVLLKELAQKSKVDIPQTMVDNTVADMLEEFKLSLKNQGTTFEKYLETTKTTEDDLKKNMRSSAEERAKEQLTMKNLIEKEKLSVSDKELDKAIEETSKEKEQPITRKELEEKGLIGYLKSNILYRKALNFLVKKTEQRPEQEAKEK